jgi:taurine dioxygenase
MSRVVSAGVLGDQGASLRYAGVALAPATGSIGATVTGIDLSQPQAPEVTRTLEQALHEHGVLFFHGQALDDAVQKQFARCFGELHRFPNSKGWADPEILVLDSEVVEPVSSYVTRWHTDASFEERPPMTSVLRPVVIPPYGGDTLWATMYGAYEALSSHMQRLLDDLDALHSNQRVGRSHAMTTGEIISAVHPVIIVDALTGRRALYVNSNYTQSIVGMTQTESDAVLRFLFDHVKSPDFQVRLRWSTDTVAVWEERVTQHCALGDLHGARRIVHRVTVCGDPPSRAPRAHDPA